MTCRPEHSMQGCSAGPARRQRTTTRSPWPAAGVWLSRLLSASSAPCELTRGAAAAEEEDARKRLESPLILGAGDNGGGSDACLVASRVACVGARRGRRGTTEAVFETFEVSPAARVLVGDAINRVDVAAVAAVRVWLGADCLLGGSSEPTGAIPCSGCTR